MPLASHLSSFVPRRYDELVALLHAHGFDIAWNTAGNSPNEWNDAPPLGFVRIKGVWLPRADQDDDAEKDERVTLSLMEWWATRQTDYAQVEREGLWLAAYSYNAHIAGPSAQLGDREHRHDFDPSKDTALVHHLHPFGERNGVRRPEDLVSAEQAIADFLLVLREEIDGGRFEPR